MAKVKYVGPHDEVEIPALGLTVKKGEVIDVEDVEGFVHQTENWQAVKAAAPAPKEADQ